MPRKPRTLDREDGIVRDASLIVIASEDTYAVEHYFQRFRTTRVQVRVLPTEDGRSSPTAVVQRLDEYANEFQLGATDELWACIDLDHWARGGHLPNLIDVISRCRDSGYQLAISSPCFELWMYLHFSVAPAPPVNNCHDMTIRLRGVVPSYTKKDGHRIPIAIDQVMTAITRAQSLPDALLLKHGTPATGLHHVLASLRKREPLRLR